jgi:hypothetical protein
MAITHRLCNRLAFESTSPRDGTVAAVNQTAAPPIQTSSVFFDCLEVAANAIGKAKK